eukprot:2231486-Amphidinium_carterae.1
MFECVEAVECLLAARCHASVHPVHCMFVKKTGHLLCMLAMKGTVHLLCHPQVVLDSWIVSAMPAAHVDLEPWCNELELCLH